MAEIIEEGEEGGFVVSERVQVLAQGIYDEFQAMVETYGPESIGNLMPLVVNVLENFDSALSDNQDHLTALMEVNEENQLLSKQYGREKQKRREIEEKSMRLEDMNEQETRELTEHVNTLLLENKSFASKLKSQIEYVERMEERHENMRREKKDIHARNIELIRQIETLKKTESAAIKIAVAKSRSLDEMAESPRTNRVPGFEDFLVSTKTGKKKRQLPIAPRRRARASTGDDDDTFLGTTPANRPDSPEYVKPPRSGTPPNLMSLHDEPSLDIENSEEEGEGSGYEEVEVEPVLQQVQEKFAPNEDSLLAELNLATTGKSIPGVEDIILENEQLLTDKNQLTTEVDDLMARLRDTENEKQGAESRVATLQTEKTSLTSKVTELDGEVRKLRRELEEEKEKTSGIAGEVSDKAVGPEGLRLTRLEVARVLRERNEYKEKYLSLLEQIRMNDELYLFKRKEKKSRWVDYFAALFSPSKRRQMEQNVADSTPKKPILGKPSDDADEEDGGQPHPSAAGYRKTRTIPILRKMGRRQDEVYMTSVSWVIPALDQQHSDGSMSPTLQPSAPNINTCRPMSYQEDGAKVLCTAAVNPATFLDDCAKAINIRKDPPIGSTPTPDDSQQELSMSLVWIVTGVPNLTKVSILDAAAVGEVLDTFPVCSNPIQCIVSVPEFDDKDPNVQSSLSAHRRKPVPTEVLSTLSDRPSPKHATMWMGSDTGVLYVHSAISQWKKCIHADKLPAAIQSIIHLHGKVFLLLKNANLVVFRRFPDGEWDWDNYSIVVLTQRKDLPTSSMVAAKDNVWCAIGNNIHVIHSQQLRMEATFTVHPRKRAEVNNMVTVGDGVWMSFKYDSTIRLFNALTFTHMQDLDIAPCIHRILVFGSEKRSAHMSIQVSTLVAAHNALWVGTENGVLLAFPFNTSTVVAEETGWELIRVAEVGGKVLPEPFDVRTEHAVEAGTFDGGVSHPLESSKSSSGDSHTDFSESPLPPAQKAQTRVKTFNPFCNVDQVELSIHCHINAVKSLISVPALVPKDLAVYEPLGGVYIGSGDASQRKPALFVVSCGEGHLDLRTADKVLETLHAKESGQSGLPSAASILSDKNYIMVWDIIA